MIKRLTYTIALLLLCFGTKNALSQSIHFSQYYNAPMLLNPANTALMPDYDYRGGANFRNQWATIPVPYTTVSAFADFKVAGNNFSRENNNWIGLGLAFFNDKAGDGNLSLTQFQGNVAYHLHLSKHSMLSAGFSAAHVQRSVNYDNLTFDAQWDGFVFNTNLPNNEKNGIIKTSYNTLGAGLNYAYFPNDNVYMKLGVAAANINQPVESFYGGNNQIGIRPTANLDMLFRTGPVLILNPSFYYTTQKGAYEFVYGTLFRIFVGGHGQENTQLILGIYNRMDDALVAAAGFQWGGVQFMASYDATISSLSPYDLGYGAIEFSIIYQGLYSGFERPKRTYNCPRFF